jgi:ComF family protein
MRKALHALKYRRDTSLAGYLVNLALPKWPLSAWNIHAVVPIPMGHARERQRGYNQARLIAEVVSEKTGLPIETESLFRTRETRTQVGLSLVERQENLRDAFSARSVQGKRILLVDDVCTTGATLESGAKALRNSGAEAVFGIAIARAIPAVLARYLAVPHPITGETI